MRHTFLARIYLMDELSDLPHTLKFLEQLRTRWAPRLEALKNAEKEWSRRDPGFLDRLSLAAFHQHLTLRMGQHSYQGCCPMRRVRCWKAAKERRSRNPGSRRD